MKRLMFLLTLLIMLPFYFSSVNCTNQDKISAAIYGGEEVGGSSVPFALSQNSPNPFNGSTLIQFANNMEMHIIIKVFTEDWLEVETLVDDFKDPGQYVVLFSPSSDLPSGEYYYTMEALGYTVVRKMMLMK